MPVHLFIFIKSGSFEVMVKPGKFNSLFCVMIQRQNLEMKKLMKNLRRISFITILLILSGLFFQSMAQTPVSFDTSKHRQVIHGFGGSIAYYENWVVSHPRRAKMYDLIFKDLGISILRLRNSYMNEGGTNNGVTDLGSIVKEGRKRGDFDIMISSWSPPGTYKSNGKPQNDETKATLARDVNGNFVYGGFAGWWYRSLLEYQELGMPALYVSIQNEPNWDPGYEGCIFMPQEQEVYDDKLDSTYLVASYARAFSDVYDTLHAHSEELEIMPRLIGPEVLGIENAWDGRPRDYTSKMDMTRCWGMAHHLYTGGSEGSAGSYIANLGQLARDFPDIPKLQTEYSMGDWYFTAMLVLNSLVYENVSVYLLWDLVWPGSKVIDMENPWTSSSWMYPDGFKAGKNFYAFKHYSAFVKPGYVRIDTKTSNTNIKSTAFISPSGNEVVMVLVNTYTASQNISIDPMSFEADSGSMYRTSETEDCLFMGTYFPGAMKLPGRSITTLVLTKSIGGPDTRHSASLAPVLNLYPNPVTEGSVLHAPGFNRQAIFRIYGMDGREMESGSLQDGVAPRIGGMLSPGIYLIKVEDGYNSLSLKFQKR